MAEPITVLATIILPESQLAMRRPTPLVCRRIGLLAGLLLVLSLAACEAPIKVQRVGLRTAYAELNRTALSSDQLSEPTRAVLRNAALLDTFDS